jgi:hypothetical protein
VRVKTYTQPIKARPARPRDAGRGIGACRYRGRDSSAQLNFGPAMVPVPQVVAG